MKVVATALYIAAQERYLEVVQALLASGAITDAAQDSRATPLVIAAELGHAQGLLASGARAKAKDSQIRTAFALAILNNHEETAQVLRAARGGLVI